MTKVITVEEILRQGLLYDFYGELLNMHQKNVYEQFLLEDLSLSEIAQNAGISRQGVHDLVRRCQKTLEGYEAKLHLVERFCSIQKKMKELERELDSYEKTGGDSGELIRRIRQISDSVMQEL